MTTALLLGCGKSPPQAPSQDASDAISAEVADTSATPAPSNNADATTNIAPADAGATEPDAKSPKGSVADPPTAGPALWEAAYQRALGPEPVWTPPAPPWPDCATTLVRRPLEAEHKRRQDAARAEFNRERDNWYRAGQPVRNAASNGFYVTAPSANAPFQDKVPEGAAVMRAALGTLGPTPCFVRDIRPSSAAPSAEERAAATATGQPLTGPSAYHILCASTPEVGSARKRDSGPSFLVTVPARSVAARLDGKTLLYAPLQLEAHFEKALRGKIPAIGVGDQLEITGIGRLTRGARDPGFGWRAWNDTDWAVDFSRACPYEGAACTVNDAQPTVVVRAVPASACGEGLAARADDLYEAWRRMQPTSPDAQLLAGWIESFAPGSSASKRVEAVRKRVAGDLEGAALLFSELSDADGLAEIAALFEKAGATQKAALVYRELRRSAYVRIEPGEFMMGSPPEEAGHDADEVSHRVTITRAFWLKKTEVTQQEWEGVMGTNPSTDKRCGPSCPVTDINWPEALDYANRLSDLDGLPRCYKPGGEFVGLACEGYRLPTEAEWEYAARAGSTAARYGSLEEIAWYAANSQGRLRPVGQKLPNAWGLHDMLGNVWEWLHDWYGDYAGEANNPTGPEKGDSRVYRGGSWNFDAGDVRAANRNGNWPGLRNDYLGFRVARSIP